MIRSMSNILYYHKCPTGMSILKSFVCVLRVISGSGIIGQNIQRSVISNGGEDISNGSISIQFTLGELAIDKYKNEYFSVQEGFHAGTISNTSTPVFNHHKDFSVKVWPNPTAGLIFFEGLKFSNYKRIIFFDQHGKVVLTREIDGWMSVNIDLLPSGLYTINIVTREGNVYTEIIMKH